MKILKYWNIGYVLMIIPVSVLTMIGYFLYGQFPDFFSQIDYPDWLGLLPIAMMYGYL